MTEPAGSNLLDMQSLRKEFRRRSGVVRALRRAPTEPVVAVNNVSLTLRAGETLGVVGESGSGKSTLGRMILGLIQPTSGSITFAGRDITHRTPKQRRELTRDLQVVFQDPYGSLNPRHRVEDIIREPLDIHQIGTPEHRRKRVSQLMDRVALADRFRRAFPHELSGGLRQRVGIAAALAVNPRVIVADEPVSALDVSVQAQIMDLLSDLQRETFVGMIFISHDLSVVREISQRVAVMRHGVIVEDGDVESIFRAPQHPYTKALLSAILPVDPDTPFNPILLDDDVVSPAIRRD
jgi:ABC-type glutathione transport system ATPase component